MGKHEEVSRPWEVITKWGIVLLRVIDKIIVTYACDNITVFKIDLSGILKKNQDRTIYHYT